MAALLIAGPEPVAAAVTEVAVMSARPETPAGIDELKSPSVERERSVLTGWLMLPITIALYIAVIALFIIAPRVQGNSYWIVIGFAVFCLLAAALLTPGFFTLQPNEARVLILFGDYKGSVKRSGFFWGNPFYANGSAGQPPSPAGGKPSKGRGDGDAAPAQAGKLKRYKVSLRARTLNGERLKVNDKRGNPVDIAAVVVWRVHDTARAVFDVEDFETYVATQSETAVRHLASAYPYDSGETFADTEDEVTLRGNVDEVSEALRVELSERLGQAGVVVEQARLTHLAYSPEIAQAMLRRQQAEAVIAARRKIVTGAVSMVEMALQDFKENRIVEFDEERKAAMVSNLMVVLCGESQVTPVVNTGTLYQ